MELCKQCKREIKDNIVLGCTCGQFCSRKCLDEFHAYQGEVCDIERVSDKLRTHPSGNICCQGCYKIGLAQGKEEGKVEGKQQAEDIKANQLADHYQKGKLETVEELNNILDLYKDSEHPINEVIGAIKRNLMKFIKY